MDPKQHILERIRSIRQADKPYPPQAREETDMDLVERFKDMVNRSGSELLTFNQEEEVVAHFQQMGGAIQEWISTWTPLSGTITGVNNRSINPQQPIPGAIIRGVLGVAENGAIWVPSLNMGWRALPFLAEHLMLIIRCSDLVATMHDAYPRITPGDYGLFIAGPSKTADIEQHLVLGAQGPLAHTVILIG